MQNLVHNCEVLVIVIIRFHRFLWFLGYNSSPVDSIHSLTFERSDDVSNPIQTNFIAMAYNVRNFSANGNDCVFSEELSVVFGSV